MSEKSKKKTWYISGAESREISRFNRKLLGKLERERDNTRRDPSTYITKMYDENNIVEFDNVCTYFFTDIGTVKAVDGVSFDMPKAQPWEWSASRAAGRA